MEAIIGSSPNRTYVLLPVLYFPGAQQCPHYLKVSPEQIDNFFFFTNQALNARKVGVPGNQLSHLVVNLYNPVM